MSETPSQQILRSPALFQERHNHVIVGSSERPPPKPKVSSFLLPAVGFVATAVFSSLGYQVLFYQGAAGEGLTMITVFPAYLGMLLLFLVPRSHLSESFAGTSEDPPDLYDLSLQAAVLLLSLLDVTGNALSSLSVSLSGSGVRDYHEKPIDCCCCFVRKLILPLLPSPSSQ